MAVCPCKHLQWGAGGIAWSIYAAENARTLMGADFATLFTAALGGNLSWAFAAWMASTGIAGLLFVAGWRAAHTHVDALYPPALLRACAFAFGGWFAFAHGWRLSAETWGTWASIASRGMFLAVIAYMVAGIWLQLRGLTAGTHPRQEKFRAPPPEQPGSQDWALTQEVARLRLYEVAAGEMAAFLRERTVKRTLQIGLHSDGKRLAEVEQRKLDALFARMADIFDRYVEAQR